MISLFRKIRQKLLSQNQVTRYLIYAIGEIILVVIGIFIAIQANNWNVARIQQRELAFELKKLTENLKQDIIELEFLLEDNISIASDLDSSLIILKSPSDYTKAHFLQKFFPINQTVNFNSSKISFNNLSASGKLQAIKNEALIDSLFQYYNYDNYMSTEAAIVNHTRDVIRPYLMGFDFLTINSERLKNHNEETAFNFELKSLEDYSGEVRIINGIRFKIFLHSQLNRHYQSKLSEAKKLIAQINEEIN